MHGFGQLSSPAIVSAFDLSRFQHLVDLGGATGHLAAAARERYPKLETTVLDLPKSSGNVSGLSLAVTSLIRCRRPIFTRPDAFCTIGPMKRSLCCCAKNL